ncbi:MAG: hypothetical protein WA610_15245 [Thermodesulfovibrionales bacterium]
MEHPENEQNSKIAYEKPRLSIIELAAEEVLAAGCKTVSGGGSLPIAVPCNFTGCAGLGS